MTGKALLFIADSMAPLRNNSPMAFTESRSREIGPISSVLLRGNI